MKRGRANLGRAATGSKGAVPADMDIHQSSHSKRHTAPATAGPHLEGFNSASGFAYRASSEAFTPDSSLSSTASRLSPEAMFTMQHAHREQQGSSLGRSWPKSRPGYEKAGSSVKVGAAESGLLLPTGISVPNFGSGLAKIDEDSLQPCHDSPGDAEAAGDGEPERLDEFSRALGENLNRDGEEGPEPDEEYIPARQGSPKAPSRRGPRGTSSRYRGVTRHRYLLPPSKSSSTFCVGSNYGSTRAPLLEVSAVSLQTAERLHREKPLGQDGATCRTAYKLHLHLPPVDGRRSMLQIKSHGSIASHICELQVANYTMTFCANALQIPKVLSVVTDVAGGLSAGKPTSGTTRNKSIWEASTSRSMQVCAQLHIIAYLSYFGSPIDPSEHLLVNFQHMYRHHADHGIVQSPPCMFPAYPPAGPLQCHGCVGNLESSFTMECCHRQYVKSSDDVSRPAVQERHMM